MTRDDIIRMAREAYRAYMDWADRDDPWRREHGSKYYEDEAIKRAALSAAAAEREANLECVGRIAAFTVDPIDRARLFEAMDAIRARGQT
jgi:hypothetical protein